VSRARISPAVVSGAIISRALPWLSPDRGGYDGHAGQAGLGDLSLFTIFQPLRI